MKQTELIHALDRIKPDEVLLSSTLTAMEVRRREGARLPRIRRTVLRYAAASCASLLLLAGGILLGRMTGKTGVPLPGTATGVQTGDPRIAQYMSEEPVPALPADEEAYRAAFRAACPGGYLVAEAEVLSADLFPGLTADSSGFLLLRLRLDRTLESSGAVSGGTVTAVCVLPVNKPTPCPAVGETYRFYLRPETAAGSDSLYGVPDAFILYGCFLPSV